MQRQQQNTMGKRDTPSTTAAAAATRSRAPVSWTSVPNLLTMSRIVVIPLFVASFYLTHPLSELLGVTLFGLASITDFFDGYLARAWNQQSSFGRFLDPLADKLLVSSALLLLVAHDRIAGHAILAAVIILCREVLVSGLREFLAELQVIVHVSTLAKYKTTLQMVALWLLILGEASPAWFPGLLAGNVLLWVAAALTIVTGVDYMIVGMRHISAADSR